MKSSDSEHRQPFKMLEEALAEGWLPIDSIPLAGEGEFLALTLSGLVRLVKNRKTDRKPRRADGYGPKRTSVNSVETGNYLAAIAWRWPRQID